MIKLHVPKRGADCDSLKFGKVMTTRTRLYLEISVLLWIAFLEWHLEGGL